MNQATRHSLFLGTRRGFTVIELLLALVIGTMILGATSAVYVTTLDSWRRGSRAHARMQAADKIGALIERHLRAAISPAIDAQAVFIGEDLSADPDHPAHRLTLHSAAAGRFPRNLAPSDTSEIAFEYDPASGDGMTMRIQSPPDDKPDEGGYLVKLSPLVRGFRVIYYDGEDWVESWEEKGLPQAVEYTLQIADPPEEDSPMAENADSGGDQSFAEIKRLVWLPMGEAGAVSDESGGEGGASAKGTPAPGGGSGASGDSGGSDEGTAAP